MTQIVKHIVLIYLLLPIVSYSQEPDSIKPKLFENFFGSDCPVDTMIESIGKNDQCILYAREYKLCRIKKDRIVWTIELDEFRSSDYICMVLRPTSNKRKMSYVFILGYTNEAESVRKLVKFPSGKVLATKYIGAK